MSGAARFAPLYETHLFSIQLGFHIICGIADNNENFLGNKSLCGRKDAPEDRPTADAVKDLVPR